MLTNSIQEAKRALRVMAGTPRALRLIFKSSPRLASALVVSNVLLGLVPLAELWMVKLIVDAVATCFKAGAPVEQTQVIHLLGALALIRILNNSLEPTTRLLQEQLGDSLVHDVNLMILNKANSLVDISVFENAAFHDKLTQAQQEAGYRPLTLLTNLTVISRCAIALCSLLGVIFALQPLLAIMVLVLALPNLIIQFKIQNEIWAINNFETPEVRRMRYFSQVLTDLGAASELRLFNLGDLFINKYKERFREFRASHAKLRIRHWQLNFILANIAAIGLIATYAYVAISALQNKISIGTLSLYMTAAMQIEMQLEGLVWSTATLYHGNLFINNLFDFLDLESPVALAPKETALQIPAKLQKGIRFENVSFKYPQAERFVFENLSFELGAGESIALVGENGAGKTTIVKLLSRLYEPTSGRILVDDIDLREYDIESWRKNLAVIFQDYARFHITARENVGVGNVEFIEDLERIQAAAAKGAATGIIEKLPEKYDTTLGKWFSGLDNGTDLSGGEWQKIAISRAFMRDSNAQLLILDEPTSALDAQAEYDIYLQFHELTKGKTTFLISHRFSTVRMADTVLVIDKGQIIERGSHNDLMIKDGEYARLYRMQADRYK
ncbi:MAG TPA: ABC transporter ATP-binding protein [Drouetiella sp.]